MVRCHRSDVIIARNGMPRTSTAMNMRFTKTKSAHRIRRFQRICQDAQSEGTVDG